LGNSLHRTLHARAGSACPAGRLLAAAIIVRIVWGPRLRYAGILVAVLAGSQLGHALVYAARFGLDAGSRQASGVHGYFPALTGGLSAVMGVLLMTSLLVIAAARSLRPAPAVYLRATTRFFDILPLLFLGQLVVFMAQETIEGLVAYPGHMPSVVQLFLWGTLGQLPAATIAAGILTWLLARLETAWAVLLHGPIRVLDEPHTPARQHAPRPQLGPARRLAAAYPSAFRKRGPPAFR
jgi:hypothetical protein